MKNVTEVEFGKNITIKGSDLGKGLWRSLNQLAADPSLAFTVKARVAAIFRDLEKVTREFQKEYDAAVDVLKWEGKGEKRTCLEQDKLLEINQTFENKEFVIIGRKLKADQIQNAKVSAIDLMALEPLLDGVL